jgi:5-methylcytosine-specific restriction endonuclease McrA
MAAADRMTPEFLEFVILCIKENNTHAFYISGEWTDRREDVLDDDKYECQQCKKRGKYKRATMVHHVKHLKDHPELALSLFYIDEHGKLQRQLISLCNTCHEEEHPERRRSQKNKKPLTPERW